MTQNKDRTEAFAGHCPGLCAEDKFGQRRTREHKISQQSSAV